MKLSSAALTGLWLWIFLPSLAYSQQEIQGSATQQVPVASPLSSASPEATRPPKLANVLRGENSIRRADFLYNTFRGTIRVEIATQTEIGKGYALTGTYTSEENWRERCNYFKNAPFHGWYGNDGSGLVLRMTVRNQSPNCIPLMLSLRPGNGHAFWYQNPDESLQSFMFLDPS